MESGARLFANHFGRELRPHALAVLRFAGEAPAAPRDVPGVHSGREFDMPPCLMALLRPLSLARRGYEVVVALIERFSTPKASAPKGTLSRARAFLSLLVDGVLGAEDAHDVRDVRSEPPPALPLRSELLDDPAFVGVAGTRAERGLLLSWRTTPEQLASARGIASGPRSLRLILVRASGQEVAVDTVDLGEVSAEGARILPDVPGLLRAVASIGLFDGARFVSMAHGSVA